MAANTPIPRGAYEQLRRKFLADERWRQSIERMNAARQAEDMKGRHSVGPDERRPTNPNLISNALLAGTLGGAMSAAGLPSVGLRAGLIGGGLTDATLNAGNPEGGAEISGALAAAGALGRHSIPAAIAALGASSSEAQAAALQKMKQLFYHGSNQPLRRGKIDGVLDVSPQRRVAEYFANKRVDQLGGAPNVYEVLADPFAGRKHGLALPFDRIDDSTPNFTQARELSEKDRPLKLRVGDDWQELAGGGVIKRLGKRAMSQFDELRPSSVAPQGALSVIQKNRNSRGK